MKDFKPGQMYVQVRKAKLEVTNFDQASDLVRDAIEEDCIGSRDFFYGQIFQDGKQVASVRYNGTVVELTAKAA